MLRFLFILPALLASAVQGYDFVRYDNAAARALATAGEKYRLQPEPSAPAVAAPVPAGEVERLLYSHLAAGFALPEDWFTNADGSVLVFLSEPAAGLSSASLPCTACRGSITTASGLTASFPARTAGCLQKHASIQRARPVA